MSDLSLIIETGSAILEFAEGLEAEGITVLEGDLIDYDVTRSESHELKAKVTRHPIEDGANVADHVLADPDKLTITGVVTNSPLKYQVSLQYPLGSRRAESSFTILRAALKAGSVFSISTSLFDYDDMVMTSLSVPRDKDKANGVEFTATFEQIRKVSSVDVAAPVDPKAVKSKGRKPSKQTPANKATKARGSFLSSIVDWVSS